MRCSAMILRVRTWRILSLQHHGYYHDMQCHSTAAVMARQLLRLSKAAGSAHICLLSVHSFLSSTTSAHNFVLSCARRLIDTIQRRETSAMAHQKKAAKQYANAPSIRLPRASGSENANAVGSGATASGIAEIGRAHV